jgi:hypothetical protein
MFTFEDEFSFNCFTQIFRKKEYWKESDAQVELASFFNRGAAIQLPKGYIGADLLLPIRRKFITGKSGTEKYSYFYLLVQIKNDNRNVCPYIFQECTEMLDRTFEKDTSWARCNIGWSSIMNVGQEREEACWYGETSIQNKKGSGGKPLDASISQCKYFVVNGIGQVSYPKILEGQSSLISTFSKMLCNQSYDEWMNDCGGYPMADQELDFCSFCPLVLQSPVTL